MRHISLFCEFLANVNQYDRKKNPSYAFVKSTETIAFIFYLLLYSNTFEKPSNLSKSITDILNNNYQIIEKYRFSSNK
jgi:hypothetical protein